MLRLIASVLMFTGLLVQPPVAFAQSTPFAPAVIVNDDVITFYEVDQRARLLQALGQREDFARDSAIDSLISDALMVQEAERRGIEVPGEAIAAGIEETAARRGISEEELLSRMNRTGAERDTLVDRVSALAGWRIAMRGRFAARAAPSDGDVEDALMENAMEPEREVLLGEIAFPIFERGVEATVALARQLYQDLSSGGDFRAAARQYGRTSSASQGGEVGWVRERDLPANMRRQIELLDPGQVTTPIEITRGVTFLTIFDERPVPSARAGQVQITYGRVDFPDATTARAARQGLDGCASVDGSGRVIGPVPLADTDPDLFSTLAQISPGLASQPIETSAGATLVVVCNRSVEASVQERDQMTEQLFAQSIDSFAESYLQDLRRNAIIDRR